jgi:hypothetical protein
VEVLEDDIREQVQKILDSDLLRASEIQRRLLKYLADKSLNGEADQLKEYTVGIEGIGKSEDYDPRKDSTVRFQTSKLRQKIIEYYLTAGHADPILIDFPKGRFKLVFAHREAVAETAADESARRWRRVATIALGAFVLALALGVLCGWSLWNLKRTAAQAGRLPAGVEAFWNPVLASGKPLLICVGTPLFERLGDQGFFRDSMANTWEQAQSSGLVAKLKQRFPGVNPEPWYVFTTLGELNGAFTLGKVLSPRIPAIQLVSNMDLSWNQIGGNSVVFVGPPKYNVQIMDLPVQQDLVLEPPAGVRNVRPKPGEPALFADGETGEKQSGIAYSLVSCLPGLNKDGHIIVLAGSGIPGTLAATQFVTSEIYASDLVRHIRLPSGELPSYYQVLIKCRYRKWVPVEISYVLHRVLSAER